MNIEPIAQILILRFSRNTGSCWLTSTKAVLERLRDEGLIPEEGSALEVEMRDLMAVTRRTYLPTLSELGEEVHPHLSGGDSGSRAGAS